MNMFFHADAQVRLRPSKIDKLDFALWLSDGHLAVRTRSTLTATRATLAPRSYAVALPNYALADQQAICRAIHREAEAISVANRLSNDIRRVINGLGFNAGHPDGYRRILLEATCAVMANEPSKAWADWVLNALADQAQVQSEQFAARGDIAASQALMQRLIATGVAPLVALGNHWQMQQVVDTARQPPSIADGVPRPRIVL